MRSGVTMLEPGRTEVEATVCVGADTVLHPGVSLLGRTAVGAGPIVRPPATGIPLASGSPGGQLR
jgi:bifunctional UDP-N-acetylglucosamine pyrophosphorylase/glucosamine-1-phosphate N-acetyltransferase